MERKSNLIFLLVEVRRLLIELEMMIFINRQQITKLDCFIIISKSAC